MSAPRTVRRKSTRQSATIKTAEDFTKILQLFRTAIQDRQVHQVQSMWGCYAPLRKAYTCITLKFGTEKFKMPLLDCYQDFVLISDMRESVVTSKLWRGNLSLRRLVLGYQVVGEVYFDIKTVAELFERFIFNGYTQIAQEIWEGNECYLKFWYGVQINQVCSPEHIVVLFKHLVTHGCVRLTQLLWNASKAFLCRYYEDSSLLPDVFYEDFKIYLQYKSIDLVNHMIKQRPHLWPWFCGKALEGACTNEMLVEHFCLLLKNEYRSLYENMWESNLLLYHAILFCSDQQLENLKRAVQCLDDQTFVAHVTRIIPASATKRSPPSSDTEDTRQVKSIKISRDDTPHTNSDFSSRPASPAQIGFFSAQDPADMPMDPPFWDEYSSSYLFPEPF